MFPYNFIEKRYEDDITQTKTMCVFVIHKAWGEILCIIYAGVRDGSVLWPLYDRGSASMYNRWGCEINYEIRESNPAWGYFNRVKGSKGRGNSSTSLPPSGKDISSKLQQEPDHSPDSMAAKMRCWWAENYFYRSLAVIYHTKSSLWAPGICERYILLFLVSFIEQVFKRLCDDENNW